MKTHVARIFAKLIAARPGPGGRAGLRNRPRLAGRPAGVHVKVSPVVPAGMRAVTVFLMHRRSAPLASAAIDYRLWEATMASRRRRRTAVTLAVLLGATGLAGVGIPQAWAESAPVAVTVDARAGLGTVPATGIGVNHAIWDTELGSDATSTTC